jgi:hypothetical protein
LGAVQATVTFPVVQDILVVGAEGVTGTYAARILIELVVELYPNIFIT